MSIPGQFRDGPRSWLDGVLIVYLVTGTVITWSIACGLFADLWLSRR